MGSLLLLLLVASTHVRLATVPRSGSLESLCYLMAQGGNDAFRARHPGGIVFKHAMGADVNWLSNFYVRADGQPLFKSSAFERDPLATQPFASVEHYYQAAKAHHLGLPELVVAIRSQPSPVDAKRLGGKGGMTAFVLEHWATLNATFKLKVSDSGGTARPPSKAALGAALKAGMAGFDEQGTMLAALTLKFDPQRNPDLALRLFSTAPRALGESRGRSASVWTIDAAGSPGLLGTLLVRVRQDLAMQREMGLW